MLNSTYYQFIDNLLKKWSSFYEKNGASNTLKPMPIDILTEEIRPIINYWKIFWEEENDKCNSDTEIKISATHLKKYYHQDIERWFNGLKNGDITPWKSSRFTEAYASYIRGCDSNHPSHEILMVLNQAIKAFTEAAPNANTVKDWEDLYRRIGTEKSFNNKFYPEKTLLMLLVCCTYQKFRGKTPDFELYIVKRGHNEKDCPPNTTKFGQINSHSEIPVTLWLQAVLNDQMPKEATLKLNMHCDLDNTGIAKAKFVPPKNTDAASEGQSFYLPEKIIYQIEYYGLGTYFLPIEILSSSMNTEDFKINILWEIVVDDSSRKKGSLSIAVSNHPRLPKGNLQVISQRFQDALSQNDPNLKTYFYEFIDACGSDIYTQDLLREGFEAIQSNDIYSRIQSSIEEKVSEQKFAYIGQIQIKNILTIHQMLYIECYNKDLAPNMGAVLAVIQEKIANSLPQSDFRRSPINPNDAISFTEIMQNIEAKLGDLPKDQHMLNDLLKELIDNNWIECSNEKYNLLAKGMIYTLK
jgi:hypothetical protein